MDDPWPAEMVAMEARLPCPNTFGSWEALKGAWRRELETTGVACLWLRAGLEGKESAWLIPANGVVLEQNIFTSRTRYFVRFGGQFFRVSPANLIITCCDIAEADTPIVVETDQ